MEPAIANFLAINLLTREMLGRYSICLKRKIISQLQTYQLANNKNRVSKKYRPQIYRSINFKKIYLLLYLVCRLPDTLSFEDLGRICGGFARMTIAPAHPVLGSVSYKQLIAST